MVLTLFVSPSVAARPTTRKDLILAVCIIIFGMKLPASYSTIQVQGQSPVFTFQYVEESDLVGDQDSIIITL